MLLAHEFVASAGFNILRILRYHTNRGKDCSTQIKAIETILSESRTAKNISELMGYEGSIRDIYYTSFNTILDLETPFETRTRRPPDNPINAAYFLRQLVDICRMPHRNLSNAAQPDNQFPP